jgi:hypothetical protein
MLDLGKEHPISRDHKSLLVKKNKKNQKDGKMILFHLVLVGKEEVISSRAPTPHGSPKTSGKK